MQVTILMLSTTDHIKIQASNNNVSVVTNGNQYPEDSGRWTEPRNFMCILMYLRRWTMTDIKMLQIFRASFQVFVMLHQHLFQGDTGNALDFHKVQPSASYPFCCLFISRMIILIPCLHATCELQPGYDRSYVIYRQQLTMKGQIWEVENVKGSNLGPPSCEARVLHYDLINRMCSFVCGRNSNGTKHSGGPPEEGREKRPKHVGVLYLQTHL